MARHVNGRTKAKPGEPVVFTIGHSTRSADELVAVLMAWGVRTLVDVRTVPRSRTNPQFNADVIADAIAPIRYVPMKALGGLRGRSKNPTTHNAAWENASFRNYADYAETPAFAEALDELIALARRETVAIMCAEAVWWRCHRRIIADYLLARGVLVKHIFTAEKADDATMTPFAKRARDGSIRYRGA